MLRLAVLLCVALALSACGTTVGGVRDEGAAAIGDKAAVSPAAAAGEDSTPEVPGASSSGAAFVYFLRYDRPEPTRRRVDRELSVPEASLRALLEGPTQAEAVLRYSTAIPPDVRLLGYAAVKSTAIVDVSDLPDATADDQGEALLALYQLVYTVTATGAIDAVQVRENGRPYGLNSLSGGSSAQEPPLTRADLSFVVDAATLPGSAGCAVAKAGAPAFTGTPSITLARPRQGARIDGALQIRGTVDGDGGPIVIRILQDQLEVANRVIDDRCRGSFAATIPVPRDVVGPVDLVVIAPGADGKPTVSVERRIVIAEPSSAAA